MKICCWQRRKRNCLPPVCSFLMSWASFCQTLGRTRELKPTSWVCSVEHSWDLSLEPSRLLTYPTPVSPSLGSPNPQRSLESWTDQQLTLVGFLKGVLSVIFYLLMIFKMIVKIFVCFSNPEVSQPARSSLCWCIWGGSSWEGNYILIFCRDELVLQ